MALINAKVGEFSIGEAFAIGLAKSLSEQLLSPVIGNGSYSSGAIKLATAWGFPKIPMVGKYAQNEVGKVILTAMAVDGVEDIITNLFRGGVTDN